RFTSFESEATQRALDHAITNQAPSRDRLYSASRSQFSTAALCTRPEPCSSWAREQIRANQASCTIRRAAVLRGCTPIRTAPISVLDPNPAPRGHVNRFERIRRHAPSEERRYSAAELRFAPRRSLYSS